MLPQFHTKCIFHDFVSSISYRHTDSLSKNDSFLNITICSLSLLSRSSRCPRVSPVQPSIAFCPENIYSLFVCFHLGPDLKHPGEYCWPGCGGKQGFCDWCGSQGLCCKKGYEGNGCDGEIGITNHHGCVFNPDYSPTTTALPETTTASGKI